MKLYQSGGFTEFTPEEFLNYVISDGLKVEIGKIQSLKILERKPFSNKGNVLEGRIKCETRGVTIGLNIGGNPRGTGYKYYIPFLKEMYCKKVGHLYVLDSLIGVSLPYLVSGDRMDGCLTPKGFLELKQINLDK